VTGPVDLAALLEKTCTLHRDNIAVTCGGRSQTYGQLWERACRLANALLGQGLRPGDRVAVLADNQLEFFEQTTALAIAGLVRCPMYTQNKPDVHAHMLDTVSAAACLVQDTYAADLAGVRDQLPGLKTVVVVGEADVGDTLDYEQLIETASPERPPVVVLPEDDHIIRFSAGTTGKPKGILHSVAGWWAMGEEFTLALPRIEEDDAYLVASPLSHGSGLMVWPFLMHGARYVVMPGFDPARFLETIERERITLINTVPTMLQVLAAVPEAKERDLSSLRAVFYATAPTSERTILACREIWGNIMYQLYGQSEVLPATILAPRHHLPGGTDRQRTWLRSAGRPTVNTVLTVRDDDDQILGVGEIGEVCVHSPGAMKGIWNDPEANAARFAPDGAIRTRDMGYLDDAGFLFLVDRREDLIISGGFNVWPLEVEDALSAHPAVREAAIVGVPDDRWGEAVRAVVVLADGEVAGPDELIAWAKERVGSVKAPKHVDVVPGPLPRNVVGKLLRREVRAPYWAGHAAAIHGA
jgi:acyl-CoA synthetase (AMP-forming)/AMP-acid ligase II